jgi:hypothetical protein
MTVQKLGTEIAELGEGITDSSEVGSDTEGDDDDQEGNVPIVSHEASPVSENGSAGDIYGDVGEPGPLRIPSESAGQSSLGDGGNDHGGLDDLQAGVIGSISYSGTKEKTPPSQTVKANTAKKLPSGSFFSGARKAKPMQYGAELAEKLPPRASPLPTSPIVKVVGEEEKKRLQLAAKGKGVVRQMVSSDDKGSNVPIRSLVAQYSKKKSTSVWQSADEYLRAHKGGRHIKVSEPGISNLSNEDIEELQELHVMIRWQDKRYQGAIGPIKHLYRDIVFRFEGGKQSAYNYIKFGSALDEAGRRAIKPELTPLGAAVLDTGSINEYLGFLSGSAPPDSVTSISTLYSRLNLIGIRDLTKPTTIDQTLSASKLTALCNTLAARKIVS